MSKPCESTQGGDEDEANGVEWGKGRGQCSFLFCAACGVGKPISVTLSAGVSFPWRGYMQQGRKPKWADVEETILHSFHHNCSWHWNGHGKGGDFGWHQLAQKGQCIWDQTKDNRNTVKCWSSENLFIRRNACWTENKWAWRNLKDGKSQEECRCTAIQQKALVGEMDFKWWGICCSASAHSAMSCRTDGLTGLVREWK